MQKISVQHMDEHNYAVQVTEGADTTHHKVHVGGGFLDDLAMPDLDEAELVRQTIAYLLEREPGDAIEKEFSLDQLSNRDPDFFPEVRDRLNA
jgi:hypothetical protein